MARIRETLAEAIRTANGESLPVLAGILAEATTHLQLRLGERLPVPSATAHGQPSEGSERLLNPEEAAAVVGGVTAKWVLRHTRGLRFRRDLSRKVVRFEEGALRRWVSARRT